VIQERWMYQRAQTVWLAFEPGSQLSRLEDLAFCESGLTLIHLPASVTVIGKFCFSSCKSLLSITFDPRSRFSGQALSLFAGKSLTLKD
jgi:hypothetical protein